MTTLSAWQKSKRFTQLSAFFLAFGNSEDEEDLTFIFQVLAEVYLCMSQTKRGECGPYTRDNKVEEYVVGIFQNTCRRFKVIMQCILFLLLFSLCAETL